MRPQHTPEYTIEGWLVGGLMDRSVNCTARAIGSGIALLDGAYSAWQGHAQINALGDNSVFDPVSQEESILEIIAGAKELASETVRRLGGLVRQLLNGIETSE